jgi:DNA ligase (NAD+)
MRCINKTCGDQVVHQITHFIKKLGVKSTSNATLNNFGITSFDKLIAFVPNKKYKSEVKLYDELYSKVFSQSKSKLLAAMNFVGLAEISINKIIDHYGYDAIENNFDYETAKCSLPNGIGDITLQKFIEGLPEALLNVNNIVNDVRWHYTQDDSSKSNAIDIKGSICVTGSLKFGSRNKFLEFAKEHGYESKSGVSKGLTYLINNDVTSNSSKNKKAKELGIKILSEDEFIKLINTDQYETSVFDL